MVSGLINANPTVYEKKERRTRITTTFTDDDAAEPIDQLEIFDILLEHWFLYVLCVSVYM